MRYLGFLCVSRSVDVDSIQKFQKWLGTRYQKDFEEIDRANEERVNKNEIAIFSQRWVRVLFFGITLGSFLAILKWSEPPYSLKPFLEERKVIYQPQAILCFGKNCLQNFERHHRVQLPFLDLNQLPDYQERDLFYRIEVDLTDEQLKAGYDTFFYYNVLGDAEFYRDGKLVQHGIDMKPIIPLFKNHHTIEIKVNSPSGNRFGMRGISAPFLTDRVTARDMERRLNGEKHQLQTAFVAQLAALCLLLVMYVTFPYRPELFAFLILFLLEILRLNFYLNQARIFFTRNVDLMISHTLFFFACFALLFFVATFFRYSLDRLKSWILHYSLRVVVIVAITDVAITSLFPTVDTSKAFFISLLGVFWVISMMISVYPLIFLYQTNKKTRCTLGALMLIGITYWVWMNILDYSTLQIKLVYHQTYDLHFFFWMASVLGIEIGRTEIRVKQALSLLPREIGAVIQKSEMKWRNGFMILLDVVGWSKMLTQLEEDETPLFMQKINEYLLSHFDHPGVSICKGTGDGFYLTFEAAPTQELLQKWQDACQKLASTRPSPEAIGFSHPALADERIVVRSAIGYGSYYFGFAQTKHLKKEFVASRVIYQLTQIMGNHSDPKGAVILPGVLNSNPSDSPPALSNAG